MWSWANSTHTPVWQPTFIRSVLTSSSHVLLCLPSYCFATCPRQNHIRIPCLSHLSTCPTPRTLLYFSLLNVAIVTSLGNLHKSRSSSFIRVISQNAVLLFLLKSHVDSRALCFQTLVLYVILSKTPRFMPIQADSDINRSKYKWGLLGKC